MTDASHHPACGGQGLGDGRGNRDTGMTGVRFGAHPDPFWV